MSVLSNFAFMSFCYVINNLKNSFKNPIYTCKQPLMMAYERSESAWDNFGKFIHQFQPKTKTLIRKLERILVRLYRQNVSLLSNQTCLNKDCSPITHTYTHTHTYIYIYICVACFKKSSSCSYQDRYE